MHHAGAQTRQMRRPARSQLIRMHDPMSEDVVPDPFAAMTPINMKQDTNGGSLAVSDLKPRQ